MKEIDPPIFREGEPKFWFIVMIVVTTFMPIYLMLLLCALFGEPTGTPGFLLHIAVDGGIPGAVIVAYCLFCR